MTGSIKVSWFVKPGLVRSGFFNSPIIKMFFNYHLILHKHKFLFDFQMHLRVCLLLALGCIASSQRFQQQRGARRPGGPPGRGGPGGPRGPPRRAQAGAPGVQRRGPGGPGPAPGVPDGFARRQSASIRPGQGERRYQVFTDPAQVWFDLYFVFVSSI